MSASLEREAGPVSNRHEGPWNARPLGVGRRAGVVAHVGGSGTSTLLEREDGLMSDLSWETAE